MSLTDVGVRIPPSPPLSQVVFNIKRNEISKKYSLLVDEQEKGHVVLLTQCDPFAILLFCHMKNPQIL